MGALGLNLNFDYIKDEMAGFNDTIVRRGRWAATRSTTTSRWRPAANTGRTAPGRAVATRINAQEVTVGAAFPMANRFELRLEGRADFPAQDVFLDGDGLPTSNQVTGTVALLGLVLS